MSYDLKQCIEIRIGSERETENKSHRLPALLTFLFNASCLPSNIPYDFPKYLNAAAHIFPYLHRIRLSILEVCRELNHSSTPRRQTATNLSHTHTRFSFWNSSKNIILHRNEECIDFVCHDMFSTCRSW